MDQQPSAGGNSSSGSSSSSKFESAGLEKLATINQVMIKQNKMKDKRGNKLFTAEEEDSDCCTRICCGAKRPFVMELKDENKVLHLKRPMQCHVCCLPCCLQYLEVSLPDGTIVGTVQQEWAMFDSIFNICDQEGNVVMKITGPCCTCCGDVNFKLTLPDGKEVGQIGKKWNGLAKKAFPDANNFGISFPEDLDVHSKATLIGAAMLIDFMFFEENVGCLDVLDCLACAAIGECLGCLCCFVVECVAGIN